ncbi:MAG: HNH endonuclease [Candidatus Desulfofervidus sp.]|nr:HNH endonuclease [Candidatus Desulfofervidus sp.]
MFAIDIHHIIEVVEGGDNELANLIALCLTCHALFHRGIISRDSIL